MPETVPEWTNEEAETLEVLWLSTLTTSAIGKMMGKSKNAVIGKAYRLRLPPKKHSNQKPRLPEPAGMVMPTRKTCAWPVGHPGEDGFHFCGAEPVTDRPYCDAHCRKAYTNYEMENAA